MLGIQTTVMGKVEGLEGHKSEERLLHLPQQLGEFHQNDRDSTAGDCWFVGGFGGLGYDENTTITTS